MNTSPDTGLGAALREGSDAALGALYDRHLPGIYDFLSRFVRDSSVAEDLAQLTFVRAWEARESLQDPARVRGWLYTIAHNLATNHVTRSRRTEPIHEQFDLAAPAPGPEDQATSREMAELVWAAAASLEPRQYAVLDLYVRHDLPTGEIAQVLDVPAAHAAVLVNRAKEALGNAVRYLLVARRRDHCVRLAELVPEGLSSLTPDQRSSVDRHMRRCPECQGLARTLTAPAELFGGLLPLPVPSSLQRDGRDYVLVAARNQRQDEGRLLGPREPYPAAGPDRRRPSRRMVVAILAGLAMIALAVGSDLVYLHRPPPDISVPRPAADLSSPSPSASPSDSPAPVTYTPPADATAGDGSGAGSPAGGGSPAGTPGGSRPPSRQRGTPAPGGSPQPAATATPTARPTATPSSTPTPTPTPTATPPPTPIPTPTPQQPGPTRPPSPPPPPPPFTVSHVALGAPGACLKTPSGYRCDFTVLVTYHNAAPGSSIAGSLTGTAASTGGRRDVRTRDFAAGVAPGAGTATVPVSLSFSSVPCAPGSSASAAIGQPNGAGSGVVTFGQGCTPG